MEEEAASLWTIVMMFLLLLLGIGVAALGIVRIGMAVGVHTGDYHAASAVGSTYWGQAAFESVTQNYFSGNPSQSAFSAHPDTRLLSAQAAENPGGLSWMFGGIPLYIHVGSAGRQEQFFGGPPAKFE